MDLIQKWHKQLKKGQSLRIDSDGKVFVIGPNNYNRFVGNYFTNDKGIQLQNRGLFKTRSFVNTISAGIPSFSDFGSKKPKQKRLSDNHIMALAFRNMRDVEENISE